MEHLELYENFKQIDDSVPIEKSIKYLKGISKELKEVAVSLCKEYSRAKNGIISGLNLHPDLKKKISKGNYPNGFDMGIDKNGYFIHTHRGRSKSHEKPDGITAKEIKFIDSTG